MVDGVERSEAAGPWNTSIFSALHFFLCEKTKRRKRRRKQKKKRKKGKKEEKRRLQLACRPLPEEGKGPRVDAAPNQSQNGTGRLKRQTPREKGKGKKREKERGEEKRERKRKEREGNKRSRREGEDRTL